ncbi:MAG: hypothetical protein F8N39_11705 [Clostridiaceae bacterium]|nr:hypothetical protein [Clostridiaceae bacterium]
MSQGLLGKMSLPAQTYSAVYTVTAGKTSTANIRLVNTSMLTAATIRLAICPPGYVAPAVPGDGDWIEPIDLPLPSGGVLEEQAMALSGGETVVVFTSAAGVVARVHGFEG